MEENDHLKLWDWFNNLKGLSFLDKKITMRFTYFFLLTLIISLCSHSLIAQKNGRFYRTIASDYNQKELYDSAAVYYDSAFHQYQKQNHYASASIVYFELEKYLVDSGYVDSTLYYLRSAYDSSKYLTRYNNNNTILSLKKSLATYYFERHFFDSTKSVLNFTLDLSVKKYGRSATQNSSLYTMQSLIDFYEGDLASASSWMQKALSVATDKNTMSEMWINYLEYNLLMENHLALDVLHSSAVDFNEKEIIYQIYKALHTYINGHLEESLSQFSQIDFQPDSTLSQVVVLKYNYLKSLFLLEKGEFDESLAVAKNHLSLAQQTYPESHPISAGYYQQICRVYNEKSDYGASREFIERLIYGMESKLGHGHPLKAEAYFEYSRLLSAVESYQQSHHLVDSAITISSNNSDQESLFLGRCYNQKGIVNFHLSELDSAENYLLKSWGILDSNLDNKEHIYLAKVLNDLGRVYQNKGIDDHSIRDYLKSLDIYRKLLGKVHPHLGIGYYNVGSLYAKNRSYRQALENYQTSLISNVFDFQDSSIFVNPELDKVMSDFILLKSLTGKAEALELHYDQSADKKLEVLSVALKTYFLIADLIDKLRTGYVSAESKEFLGEKTSYLYERAMQLCIRLSSITQDENYLQTAFFFSEKSRAGILLSGIKDANAKKIAGVPDSLLVREKELIQFIADKEVELFDELNKGAKVRRSVIGSLQNELFNLKNAYSDFIVFLENEYNNYFQLKYDSYTASVSDIQAAMLNPINKKDKKQYVLLEYFIGQDSLYIFQIKKDDFQLIVSKKPERFEGMIKGLRNSILYSSNELFVELATELYQILIPTSVEKRMHFMIVPDGVLSYLPFESLLAEYADKPLNKQKYLISQASVSYSYSATLSVEMTKNPYDYEGKNNSFTGFAPVFNDNQQFKVMSSDKLREVELTEGDSLAVSGYRYKTLSGSELELKGIFKKVNNRKFDSNAYFFNSASKKSLFDSTSLNSRFLHFATHGILDEDRPDFSGIVLTDTIGAEVLTLGEIYGFTTKAEVVTLSACETGLGKLLGGEGLVSFSRGFFFAGSKFIIVSLWEVGDESTADMAVNFYKHYAKKKRQDIYRKFQKARLRVIKNQRYDRLSDWFPFVLVGMH